MAELLLILTFIYGVGGLVFCGWYHVHFKCANADELSLCIFCWPFFMSVKYFQYRKAHPAGDTAIESKEGTP